MGRDVDGGAAEEDRGAGNGRGRPGRVSRPREDRSRGGGFRRCRGCGWRSRWRRSARSGARRLVWFRGGGRSRGRGRAPYGPARRPRRRRGRGRAARRAGGAKAVGVEEEEVHGGSLAWIWEGVGAEDSDGGGTRPETAPQSRGDAKIRRESLWGARRGAPLHLPPAAARAGWKPALPARARRDQFGPFVGILRFFPRWRVGAEEGHEAAAV